MQVLLLSDRAGVSWYQREGEIVDVPVLEAQQLIASGVAQELENNQAGAASSNPADFSANTHKHRTRRR